MKTPVFTRRETASQGRANAREEGDDTATWRAGPGGVGQSVPPEAAFGTLAGRLTTSHAIQVLQAKWKDLFETDELMVWDRPIGGLRWYFDKTTELMSFEIATPIDDPDLLAALGPLAGRQHTYQQWMSIWDDLGWTDASGDDESDSSMTR